jgi:chromate reductase
MSANLEVAVLVGSLRRESYNRKIAKVLIELAPAPLRLEIVEIRDLPHFSEDDEQTPPAAVVQFKQRIAAAQAVLFVTPEYNRSVPGVLKNALDVGSRPYGQSAWTGKPGGVVSVSVGALGGFGANHHLRQSLVFLNVPTMPAPEVYIGNAATLFDDHGKLTNDKTREILRKYLAAFAAWVQRNPAS